MVIGLCSIEIYIPKCRSLKEKRMVIKGIKDSLRNKYNISIAEVEFHNLWQRAKLAVVVVSSQKKRVEQIFSSVLKFMEENNRNFHLNNIKTEFII